MMNPKFHRCAVLVAIGALILIAIGAYITSEALGRQPASRGVLDGVVHKNVAFAVGALALVFAIWLSLEQEGSHLGWTAVGILALAGLVGWLGEPLLHASIAPLAFSAFVVISLVTSSAWSEAPELAKDEAAAGLRLFAIATPPLTLLQIVLGAAYRHKLISLLPHIGFAMILSLAILGLAGALLHRHPEHRRLRAAATWLIAIFLTQLLLGITAFILPLLKLSAAPIIVATASHVVVGSLTLAANVVLALQVQRDMRALADLKKQAAQPSA